MTPVRVRIAARETFGNVGLPNQVPTEGYVVAFVGVSLVQAVVVQDDGSFHAVSLDKLTAITPTEREEAQRVIDGARARRMSSGT